MSLDVAVRRQLKGFGLDVAFSTDGGMLGILGASGSGKSMTLKCIAGIESPDEGRVAVDGKALYDSARGINLRPQQRHIGYLFQQYALFPNMTVEQNIACALWQTPKPRRGERIRGLLRRFRLEALGDRYPAQLSGGQQQRAALARTLAYEPEALLLDEPFSALDAYLREQLQLELMELLAGYPGDVLLVTHSRDEVYHLCPRLIVLEEGRCVASGDTRAIFQNPGLLSVARLTGCKNYSRARPTGPHTVYADDWGVEFTVRGPIPPSTDCIGVRAHCFRPAPDASGTNAFPIAVASRLEGPFEWNLLFTRAGMEEGKKIWWMVGKEGYPPPPSFLAVAPEQIHLLRSEGKTLDHGKVEAE